MKKERAILGWHFTLGGKLRDGRNVPAVGEWLTHEGRVVLCSSGLHYSAKLIDALDYAPGETLHRVEVGDVVSVDYDKGVARRRRILWSIDAGGVLREFACREALGALRAAGVKAPDVVTRYLSGKDRSEAAREAAAAEAEAWAAAAWAAAAWGAAAVVARAEVRAARGAVAGAEALARAAAWAAAGAAAWAITAARARVKVVARARQNRRLVAMVCATRGGGYPSETQLHQQ